MTALLDNPATAATARYDGAYRGRRISWAEFYKEFPHLKADNDNRWPAEGKAA